MPKAPTPVPAAPIPVQLNSLCLEIRYENKTSNAIGFTVGVEQQELSSDA
jgi:hypothetical protein